MHRLGFRSFVIAASVGAAFNIGGAAHGAFSQVIFDITASSDSGEASWQASATKLSPADGGGFEWTLESPVDLMDGENMIAQLNSARIFVNQDPQVNLIFAASAGSSDTVFTITSALVSFPTINPAQARASAGVTLTDTGNGGTLTGMFANGGIYQAFFNGGAAGAGTSFAELLTNQLSASGGGSDSDSDRFPATGLAATTPSAVFDMSSEFNFTLTANDLASGTSTFFLIPTPGGAALALVAFGTLATRRRR